MNQENKNSVCCVTKCEVPLDEKFWDTRWGNQETGWDIGCPAPVFTEYFKNISNKNSSILIPGCGNAYEAEYLLQQGFTDITLIDIAPLAVEHLKKKFEEKSQIKVIHQDFFQHQGKYDLVLEQTFFCAISPLKRKDYVQKMSELLKPTGSIVGVMFDKQFHQAHPPFGGSAEEYRSLFESNFEIIKLEPCYNSIPPRKGSEVFIHFQKKTT